jgi:hypothetical protein
MPRPKKSVVRARRQAKAGGGRFAGRAETKAYFKMIDFKLIEDEEEEEEETLAKEIEAGKLEKTVGELEAEALAFVFEDHDEDEDEEDIEPWVLDGIPASFMEAENLAETDQIKAVNAMLEEMKRRKKPVMADLNKRAAYTGDSRATYYHRVHKPLRVIKANHKITDLFTKPTSAEQSDSKEETNDHDGFI